MKTLSVRESWAYYIVAGLKDVENRMWRTEYRGPLLIHVSGEYNGIPDPAEAGDLCLPVGCDYFRVCGIAHKTATMGKFWQKNEGGKVAFKAKKSEKLPDKIEREWAFWDRILTRQPPYCPTHAVIGMVELVDIVRDSPSPWAEKGQYHWILKNAQWFDKPFVGIAGKMGLFELNINLADKAGDKK